MRKTLTELMTVLGLAAALGLSAGSPVRAQGAPKPAPPAAPPAPPPSAAPAPGAPAGTPPAAAPAPLPVASPEGAPAAAESEEVSILGRATAFVASAFRQGGFFMYLILFSLLISLSIIIERTSVLAGKFSVNGRALWERIRKPLGENRIDEAIQVCKTHAETPLCRILLAGMQTAKKTDFFALRHIQNAVDEATLEVIPQVEKRTHYLQIVANISTLLALLGTVTGLIRAFAAVAHADPAQKATLLAKGISEAMNCTAFGLMTAVISMVSYALLQGKTMKIIDEVDEFSVKLINVLTAGHKEDREK